MIRKLLGATILAGIIGLSTLSFFGSMTLRLADVSFDSMFGRVPFEFEVTVKPPPLEEGKVLRLFVQELDRKCNHIVCAGSNQNSYLYTRQDWNPYSSSNTWTQRVWVGCCRPINGERHRVLLTKIDSETAEDLDRHWVHAPTIGFGNLPNGVEVISTLDVRVFTPGRS